MIVSNPDPKIEVPQYLALKCIWQFHGPNDFDKKKWASLDSTATALHANAIFWIRYLATLDELVQLKHRPNSDFGEDLGYFALVL